MKLRRCKDAKLIARLNKPVQNLHHKLYPGIFKKFELAPVMAYFESIINVDNHHFIICEDNKKTLGYIWFEEIMRPESAFSFKKHYIYIHQISVNEEHRGKGVGKLLFGSAHELAVKKSIKTIELDYWVENTNAKKIYEKMGFKLERETAFIDVWNGDKSDE